MKPFRIMAIVGTMMLGACGGPSEVRYKVIVEVDDNGSARSGASVWSFELGKPTVALASPYDARFKGEAVQVNLGGQRTLFALIRDEENDPGTVQMWPESLFEYLGSGTGDRVANLRKIAAHVGAERVLPRWRPAISSSRAPTVQYPMLVRFGDMSDPASVEQVDPRALDKAFGPGVSLKGIKVQITEEPVTVGIKDRLPWLEAIGRSRSTLIPNPPRRLADARPIQLVSPSAFSTELYK